MARKRPEQELQKSVIQFIRLAYPNAFVAAIPNGGYRRPVEAAIFKSIGVTAGVSDLFILWKPGKIGFIELKAQGERAALTPAQKAFLIRCTACKFRLRSAPRLTK